MRKLLVVVVAAIAFGALAGVAGSAEPAPRVVVWSGALQPGATARGVDVRPDGSGRRLTLDSHDRVHVGGRFHVGRAQLAGIAAAAREAAAHAPEISVDREIEDGVYVSVAVDDGARSRLVFDENRDPPSVSALLARLDAVLSHGAQVARRPTEAHAAVITPDRSPETSDCSSDQTPVRMTKVMSLQDAVAGGEVTALQAKGLPGGDSFAVDAQNPPGAPAPAAVADIDIQVASRIHDVTAADAAAFMKDSVGRGPDGLPETTTHLDTGTPQGMDLTIRFHFSPREQGQPAAPCTVQLALFHGDSEIRGHSSLAQDNLLFHHAGSILLNDNDAPVGNVFLHELGHAAFGLPDAYHTFWETKTFHDLIPVPHDIDDTSGLNDWLSTQGIPPDDGHFVVKIDPQAQANHDVMGDPREPKTHYTYGDMAAALARADLRIRGDAGTVLVPKSSAPQGFSVGGEFDLVIPYLGHVHQDGIVAYCIDLLGRETPLPGDLYDVLMPKAGEMGNAAMSALQRVADVVAAREPGPLEETPGANAAIWRVTNDAPVDRDADPAAASILDAAGVPLDPADLTFDAPHFVSPAAGIPHTVAIAAPGDSTPVQLAPLPLLPTRATLTGLRAPARVRMLRGRGRARRHRNALVIGQVSLAGRSDRVTLTLARVRGRRRVTIVRLRTLLPVGTTPVGLLARRPRPGRYVLTARGARSGTKRVTLKLMR